MASKAKRKTTLRARLAHPKPDPIFAAINKHIAADKAVEGPRRESNRLEAKGPGRSDLPGFKAAERKYNAAIDVESRALHKLIATMPTTVEGLEAFVMYLHARCWQDNYGMEEEEERTKLQTISEAVALMVPLAYSDAFKRVSAFVAKLNTATAKRAAKHRRKYRSIRLDAPTLRRAKELRNTGALKHGARQ